ncbi:MAG: double-strand break repair protein AddB [Rhizobiaceae bacterium]|nr:double-strand break repair protein AddB [Rhizobiaceae bacterium]
MTGRERPNVFSIPVGAPFLPALVDAVLGGELGQGTAPSGDPLALADTTIFVPTRRAARELRAAFLDRLGGRAAILPRIRPLGEFEEDLAAFDPAAAEILDVAPPICALDRILVLAPLVQAWKGRLPGHIRERFGEDVVVPASTSDAIWLARDLAALMDEVEIEGAEWSRLADLVPADLAGWWQVTLDFLAIVTEHFPAELEARDLSSPGAHLTAMLDAETERLRRSPPDGPVIAAGSTGSIPATARLLAAIARLPNGAVVLPGLDLGMDERSWDVLAAVPQHPSTLGHPQFGLARLLRSIGIDRNEVAEIGERPAALGARARVIGEALRPAETTDEWAIDRASVDKMAMSGSLDGVTVVEAANEHEEALAIAVALRRAVEGGGRRAALVTPDRMLARRVAMELRRFGVEADDSGGRPLARFPVATLLARLVETALTPGDPVALLSLLKNPLLRCGMDRPTARQAAATIELIALRGGTGRPDICELPRMLDARLAELNDPETYQPFWFRRLDSEAIAAAQALAQAVAKAAEPLAALRNEAEVELGTIARSSVVALENLGRAEDGSLSELYSGDGGEALVSFLRDLLGSSTRLAFAAVEWPAMLAALIAGLTVKPPAGADTRISIWGALEARLQTVDTLVLGGLNEASWPHRADADRFMSRLMKSGLDLDPPERRVGQAAHDFWMACGAEDVVLSRSVRSDGAPAVASRWLQRLLTYVGDGPAAAMRARGDRLIGWARLLDQRPSVPAIARPCPTPPVVSRPDRFSVTEIETLRRDPYAVYARRILALRPLDPLIRDPGAAERGSLFHDILHDFIRTGADPRAEDARERLLETGRRVFEEASLPPDVHAVWWPRFAGMVDSIVEWERNDRPADVVTRLTEADATPLGIGTTGATLHGRADRIDLLAGGHADVLDYKTGSYPSRGQAHTLLSPQLALEAALLSRGAFADAGARTPGDLAYVRLKASGEVIEESILKYNNKEVTAEQLSEDAWRRLELLIAHYGTESNGYISRALPFREGDTEGDYDHLARVLEWSASAGGEVEE